MTRQPPPHPGLGCLKLPHRRRRRHLKPLGEKEGTAQQSVRVAKGFGLSRPMFTSKMFDPKPRGFKMVGSFHHDMRSSIYRYPILSVYPVASGRTPPVHKKNVKVLQSPTKGHVCHSLEEDHVQRSAGIQVSSERPDRHGVHKTGG